MQRRADDSWAAFNIEGDENQFDFPLALGATVSGIRKPESTELVIHNLDASAMCRVSLQGQPRQRNKSRPAVRRLEILAPLHSQDLAELDCATECVSQLTRSLMLYRPINFQILRWHRSRLPKPPRSRSTQEVYNLSGDELRSFLTFSRRLMSLHVSRNLFDHARYLPADLDDDVRTLFGGSHSEERRVLESEAYLMIATSLFEDACKQWSAAREHQLMLLMMAAEALFADDDKSELTFRLSLRMALLNGSDDVARRKLFDSIRGCYDKRSKLVHGSWYQRKKGFVLVSDQDLRTLRNLVRGSILYFLALKEDGKAALLQTLDRGIFDRYEIAKLRERANAYWSLDGREERLHAASWTATSG